MRLPEAAPDLRVAGAGRIVLTETAAEPPVPVYDTSGPLYRRQCRDSMWKPASSAPRIEWVCARRGGIEEYERPSDPASRQRQLSAVSILARAFPHRSSAVYAAWRAPPLTQYEWARARGVITKEMIYIAGARETWAAKAQLEARPRRPAPTAKASAHRCRCFVTPEFVRSEVGAAGAPSFRPNINHAELEPMIIGPQLSHQDQRQYRQFRRDGRRSREEVEKMVWAIRWGAGHP